MSPTIEEAIGRVPAWREARSITVSTLHGGITNLNYRVDVDGRAFVARIASPAARQLGVKRRREHAATECQHHHDAHHVNPRLHRANAAA